MMEDKDLDMLLSSYKPEIGNGEEFLKSLRHRMDAVDMVMEYKAREMRGYRRRATACFVAGTVVGVLLAVLARLLPSPVELFQLTVSSGILLFLLNNVHYAVMALCSLVSVYGIVGIASMGEPEPFAGGASFPGTGAFRKG